MCEVIFSRLVDAVFKNGQLFTQSIFQTRSLCERTSNWTMLLEENRNHVWSDLSRAFFRPEVDVNMPQTGLCC